MTIEDPYDYLVANLSPWGYWKLNWSLEDSSGNNRNGAFANANASYSSGGLFIDGCVSFTGVPTDPFPTSDAGNGAILIGSAFSLTSNWTFEAWVEQAVGHQWQYLMGSNSIINTNDYWGIANDVTNGLLSNSEVGTTRVLTPSSSSPAPADSEWHHVAVVRNGALIQAYVDGRQVGTGNVPGSVPSYPTMTNLTIGRVRIGNVWLGCSARLSRVAVYQSALSSTNILDHFSSIGSYGIVQYPIGDRTVGRKQTF
jgi:Concanavalin A-like lectin/glucanases superfamily